MKKNILFAAVLGSLLLFAPNALAAITTVDLIEALDYVDDDILRLGDGFYSSPDGYDNDAGGHNYQAVFSGTFTLDSIASDDLFDIDMLCSGYGDGGGGSFFTLNNNDTVFSLGNGGSSFGFSRKFSDYLQLGTNTITYRIGPDNASNLDDYSVNQFDLTYNSAVSDGGVPVPEPATMMLFGLGFAGIVARRKK